MDHEVGPWKIVWVHGPTLLVRLLKKSILRALDPSLGVNQLCTKRKDHGPKSEGAKYAQKKQLWPFLVFFDLTSCFCLFSPWITTNTVARRRTFVLFLGYTCFWTCLWNMLWTFKHCFAWKVGELCNFERWNQERMFGFIKHLLLKIVDKERI